MIVVCDTSPICYLLLINQIEVLPQLFGQVIIPQAVRDELLAEGSTAVIQSWISQPPAWLEIRSASVVLTELPEKLGAGEREAISLAVSLDAALIVLDDFDARQASFSLGLTVTGLLGVLYQAGLQRLIDFPSAIKQLQQTTFRASPTLIQSLLERYWKSLEQ